MSNETPSLPQSPTFTPWNTKTSTITFSITTSIIIFVLSPVAVVGNALILAAIWKKTFARTPFHILLGGLAFTDFCTGLIAQPLHTATTFMYLVNPRVVSNKALFSTIQTIGYGSAIYFISITVLLITLMSVERWLHMSRRSMVTSRRGCFTVIILLFIPIPIIVVFVLGNVGYQRYSSEINITLTTLMLSCYLTTSFAYFKVYRIIRHHQQQVQANEASQNFGQPAIDIAKYKKSVASMLYILVLFSFCFIPYIVSSRVYFSVKIRLETYVAIEVSVVLLFLSSSLNPGLYIWRMNDIRNGVKKIFCRNI